MVTGDFIQSLTRRRKDVALPAGETCLKRELGGGDLVLLGLGNIVGGGIYILLGSAVQQAGPAAVVSFLFTGLAAVCSALCYAEFAARIPVAGSAYAFTYSEQGEFLAWHVAWAVILEMITGLSATSLGWSNYTRSFLDSLGAPVPWFLREISLGGFLKLDILACIFISSISAVACMGITKSKWLSHVATASKVGALVLVILCSFANADAQNWEDFAPKGHIGIIQAAGTVMFAYSGFEVVAQCAEETRDPKKDLPVGIIGSILASTVFYTLVAAGITLMVPWSEVDLAAPLSQAFAGHISWMVKLVPVAAIVGGC
eukprot:gb/GFBE01033796.1/.p1 GENE.gb/GFBE01033796.1/~~gb/GFBE01033796.1/.p1  ORF type:complete len:316 (+),score=62.83 gb/GFBE01033796.1/:1-948(+)